MEIKPKEEKRTKDKERKRVFCKEIMSDGSSVTGKKSPNVYKKLPKIDFTRKMIVFNTFTKIA